MFLRALCHMKAVVLGLTQNLANPYFIRRTVKWIKKGSGPSSSLVVDRCTQTDFGSENVRQPAGQSRKPNEPPFEISRDSAERVTVLQATIQKMRDEIDLLLKEVEDNKLAKLQLLKWKTRYSASERKLLDRTREVKRLNGLLGTFLRRTKREKKAKTQAKRKQPFVPATQVYHEKQRRKLCGLHALNNLLQEEVFTDEELFNIARGLDEKEKALVAEDGDPAEFISTHWDSAGNFSTEVLTETLATIDMDMVRIGSDDARALEAARAPTAMDAYIVNFRGKHWLALKKFQDGWYFLDSLDFMPEKITDEAVVNIVIGRQDYVFGVFLICEKIAEKKRRLKKISPKLQTITTSNGIEC